MVKPVRLNKFLAERLGISRRDADDAISDGLVTVDGRPAVIGERIEVPDAAGSQMSGVIYKGRGVPFGVSFSYYIFHKPVGYVCSRKAQGVNKPTLYDLLPREFRRFKTVGRLDRNSSGLILLTDDGDYAFQMTHPKFQKEKIYMVELDHGLEPLHQQMISDHGVEIGDGPSQFLVVRDENYDDRKHFFVTLTEGRNRQIRRTFAALGYRVVKLHRLTFDGFELGDLKPGEYREIKAEASLKFDEHRENKVQPPLRKKD